MSKVHVYPRGFMSGPSNDDVDTMEGQTLPQVVQIAGDPVIMALFNEYQARSFIRNSGDFKIQVVKRFLQLTGNTAFWLQRNVNNNRYLYDQNFDFLLDTIRFINTGRRSISSFSSWFQLMSEHPDPKVGVTNGRWNQNLQKFASTPMEDVIAKWLSHPTGMDDLMMTAYIMFGESKTPRKLDHHTLV